RRPTVVLSPLGYSRLTDYDAPGPTRARSGLDPLSLRSCQKWVSRKVAKPLAGEGKWCCLKPASCAAAIRRAWPFLLVEEYRFSNAPPNSALRGFAGPGRCKDRHNALWTARAFPAHERRPTRRRRLKASQLDSQLRVEGEKQLARASAPAPH